MLCILSETKLFCLHVILQLSIIFYFDCFALNLFLPTNLIQAFSEKYYIGQYNFIENFVDFERNFVEIESKDLIN